MNPCMGRNGTYSYTKASTHTGRHARTELVRDARNVVVERRTHTWVNAFSPVRTTRVTVG